MVKQNGTELRSRTLASIKPEISQALPCLLDEVQESENARVMGTAACPLCKQAGRADHHYLSECTFLPERNRRYMAKARQIVGILKEDKHDRPYDSTEYDTNVANVTGKTNALRIQVRP